MTTRIPWRSIPTSYGVHTNLVTLPDRPAFIAAYPVRVSRFVIDQDM